MRNRISKILLSMFLAGSLIVPAMSQEEAGTYVLDMQGAIDHSIAYNKSLKNARMEVERSDASVWESIAQGLPQVDGSLDYMTYFNYEMEFSFGMGDEAPNYTPEQLTDAWNQTSAQFPGNPALGLNPVGYQDIYNYSAGATYSGILQSMLPPNTILLSDQMYGDFKQRQPS